MESVPSTIKKAASVRPKGRLKRFAVIGLLLIIGVPAVAHVVWKYSGSGEWQRLPEQGGIRAYSMKTPGSTVVKYKGVTRFQTTLTTITSFMQDPTTCDDVGCINPVVLDTVSPQVQYMSFVYPYGPFQAREFVVKVDVSQDPATKAVLVQYAGDPDRIALNDCCVRVPHMNNSWRFKPLGNGEVEVEYVLDMYEGGGIPYFVANWIHEKTVYRALAKVAKIVMSDKYRQKYRDVQLEFIHEGTTG